ncbi:RNA polymerase sigma factor [Pseudobythopirellula maris]|uniref:RNA polymerase sigma factor n=1 Tax=Pseudobythopirellula maris TaxID=2527991 RepID=A0A5C5ZT82_9BACT|nr:sigma-70 family RNA polymerase sigma factor [Pseudobythopirellula maris]TWT90754.1 RNA polymerase sigma factor [Pseudobythopirellula maris]
MTIQTSEVERLLGRLRDGDDSARAELLQAACDRLMRITRTIKRTFPKVGRWEQTEDVFQNASMRLYQAMESVEIADARHFYRLAAMQIRREMIDLSRRYQGPLGQGANHQTQMATPADQSGAMKFEAAEVTNNPQAVAEWGEFHEAIERLPADEREVTELLWYHGLPQQEAADLLGVDVRTIKRRWRSARLALHEALGGELPSA